MQSRPYTKREERAMVRQTRLRELGYDTYDAYLKSPAWRDLKERYRASNLPQICMCGSASVQLHHTTYDRVGREHLDDLVPLCQDCHVTAHALEAGGVIELDLKGFYYDRERGLANMAARQRREAEAALQVGTNNEGVKWAEARRLKRMERLEMFKRRRTTETPDERTKRRDATERNVQARREPSPPHANRIDL